MTGFRKVSNEYQAANALVRPSLADYSFSILDNLSENADKAVLQEKEYS